MTDKKTYTATIAVSDDTVKKWNELLAISSNEDGAEVFLRDRGYDEDSTHEAYTAYFEDGSYADIKLCAGQSNFFGDAVLFNKDGNEVCVLDCFDDVNIGDTFEFSFDERIYIAEIIQDGCTIYGADYPNHINYYYVTDVNGDVYGDDN